MSALLLLLLALLLLLLDGCMFQTDRELCEA